MRWQGFSRWTTALVAAMGLTRGQPAEALARDRAITQFVREAWTVRDGAPAGTITGITQTTNGYLWLATEGEGLLRFDGVSFTREDGLDTLFGRRVDRVTSLISGRDGALWVGTTYGLARMRDGQWTAYDRGDAKHVFGLHQAPDGTIWYARHWEGVYRVSGETVTLLRLHGQPRFVTTDGSGTLWAGGYEGLWRISGEERRFRSTADGLPDQSVNCLYTDRDGDVWLGFQVGLTLMRDGQFVARLTTRDGLSSDDVSAVLGDRDGVVWVGTVNGGLNRRRGARFEVLTKAHGLTNDDVTALYEDREGSLWVGTATGLNRLRDASLLPIGAAEGLSPRRPLSIVERSDGTVVVSSGFGGLNLIQDGRIRVLPPQSVPGSNFDGPLHADPDGGVWSPHRDGLSYRGPRGNRRYRVPGQVTSITRDARGLVFAVATGEVFRLDEGRAERYRLADGSLLGPETFGFDYVWMLYVSSDGALWLATSRGAIVVRNGHARHAWRQGTLSVRSISEGDTGAIWLGTMAGVVRLTGETVVTFTTAEGLAEDDVHNVLSDRRGGIWLSGARGIFRASLKALEDVARGAAKRFAVDAFGVTEGMRSPVATAHYQPSACLTRDGRLWFATAEGVVVVDPRHIGRNQLPPPVVVERVLADGVPLASGPELSVPAGSEQLVIHYNGLSLLVPRHVRFRYQLEGYDRDWVEAGGRRVAFYTKPPPGTYRFRVKAANNDGVWNEEGAAVGLKVIPPLWATPLFRSAVVVLLGGLLLLGHRLRVHRIHAHARALADKVDERTRDLNRLNAELTERTRQLEQMQARLIREERLAVLGKLTAAVSHELRNPMATIRGSLYLVGQELEGASPRVRHALDRAERNIRRCDRIIDELLEHASRRPPERIAVDVDAWLESVVTEITVPPAITLRHGFASGAQAAIDCNRLFRVLVNLVMNAAEAIAAAAPEASEPGATVEIASRLVGDRVEIRVTDDGPGISREALPNIFEPFFSTKSYGVGLGLALVRQVVEQHDGGVAVASRPGETSFTLWLPALAKASETRGV